MKMMMLLSDNHGGSPIHIQLCPPRHWQAFPSHHIQWSHSQCHSQQNTHNHSSTNVDQRWSPWSNSDNGFGSILHGRRIFDCFPHWTREVETFHHGFPCNHRFVSMLSLCYSTTIYHRRPMSLALTIRSWVFGSNVPCPTVSAKLWRNFSGSDLRQVIISSLHFPSSWCFHFHFPLKTILT